MRNPPTIPVLLLASMGLSTAASLWATTVGPRPLAGLAQAEPARSEKIEQYHPRFGRKRPLIAIVGQNSATELTDFVIPYGILAQADVADLVTVGMTPGVITMHPALHLQPDTTAPSFEERYPEGADYVIVPAVVESDDPDLLAWLARQSAKGGTIVSICDGALVVANAGLMKGHRATAHWATLSHRKEHYPDVKWVENRRYVADGRIVSSAGISAAIPTSLALVEAIAGRDKAAAVARDLEVSDWSTRHDSQVFAPRFGRNLTAFVSNYALNPLVHRKEAVGVPIAAGVDEIALALTADAYSRTGRSTAFSVAASRQPILTLHGLTIVPDRVRGKRASAGRIVPLPDVKAGRQLDAALAAVAHDYSRLTAFGLALDFEYPGFQ